ncbi:MAG TPA: type IV toxin-antitoxin system AbiEi family antitoxin domain-containing protein, partial [Solirubrobacterales bacterium]
MPSTPSHETASTVEYRREAQSRPVEREVAGLAGRQYGVVSRGQLMRMGMTGSAIDRRIRAGRLHLLHPGVFAVGHRVVCGEGLWLAAVLRVGDGAVLSHRSA